jgi:hypothetical protein
LNLTTLLPLLRGWRYLTAKLENVSMLEGEMREVASTDKPGWIKEAIFTFNNPNVRVIVEYYDPSDIRIEESFTPYELYNLGLLQPNPAGWYCPRFDTANDIYGVASYPSLPDFFSKRARVLLQAPPEVVSVIYGRVMMVSIENMDEFIKSIRDTVSLPVPVPTYVEVKPPEVIPARRVPTGGVTE